MKFTLSFIGFLGSDAVVKQIGTNSVINFSVAVTKTYKDQNGVNFSETTWISCSMWRKSNETTVAQYLTKGKQVYIEGEPTARAFLNSQQQAQSSLECRVDKLEFVGGAKENQNTQTTSENKPQGEDDLPY